MLSLIEDLERGALQNSLPGRGVQHYLQAGKMGRTRVTWDGLGCTCLALVLCLLWLVPNPSSTDFKSDPTAGANGTVVAQILWVGLLIFALWSTQTRLGFVRRQMDLSVVVLVGWCGLTTVYALVPDVSFRRLLFTLVCAAIFCLLFSGIATARNLLLVLLAMCVLETLTKYVAVFAFPGFGRQPAVGPEPMLAGLWRGQYYHKNVAGAVCVIELAVLYGCRRLAPIFVLLPLAMLEGIFLVFSGSKTPLFTFGVVFVITKVILSLRSFPAILAVVLGVVACLNILTLGPLFSDDAQSLTAAIVKDVTFTGRMEIWRFLVHYMDSNPLMGAGFQSFWQIGDLSPAVQDGRNWVSVAVYGHQGFLDTAVMIGIPGLILTLIFVIVRPCADLAAIANRRDPFLETSVMFWLFGLLENGTESVLLARADCTWLFLLAGIVALRRLRVEPMSAPGNLAVPPDPSPARYPRVDRRHNANWQDI